MEDRKRKPLSDISNTYDLIPTSTLRKLISTHSHSHSHSHSHAVSIFKSGSGFTNLDSSPTLNKTDVVSDTSVGSSSNVDSALNAATVRTQTHNRPISSLDSLGGGGSKVVHRRKQTTDTIIKQREAAAVIHGSTHVLQKNDKGKSIPGNKKDTGNVVSERPSTEKTVDRDMVDISFLPSSFEKMKAFQKGTLNFSSCSSGKMQNGNTVLNKLSCPKEKIEDPGKLFSIPSNWSYDDIKGKGKVIVEFPGSSVQKTKDVGETSGYSSSGLVKKIEEKGKLLNPFGSLHDKTRNKGKTIYQPPGMIGIIDKSRTVSVNCRQTRRMYDKRTEDTGNTVLNYLSCPKEKIEEQGKVFSSPSNWSCDKTKDKGNVIVELPGFSLQKAKDVGITSEYSSSFLVDKIEEKGKFLNPFVGLHDKTLEKGKTICQPPDMVEIADKRLSATVFPFIRRKFHNGKDDAGASSCTPVRRTKNIENDLQDAVFVESSKSRTAAPPKFRKERCHTPMSADESCLSSDFIKQQTAYFKEVDDFVLAEEEISPSDLD